MRYFVEVSYHGKRYAGFQIQHNAVTVQAEMETALATLLRQPVGLTGSSRTDAGVHALQNFFHFDVDHTLSPQLAYNLNALLPHDISVQHIFPMPEHAHSRFDATARQYRYYISRSKNPFTCDRAWHYPFPLALNTLQAAAALLLAHTDFTSFSKRNTQTKTMICYLQQSTWQATEHGYVYEVRANRFLRGMVRGLVATMLQAGRGKITLERFEEILHAKDCTQADFSAPGHGLFLEKVIYPAGYLPA
jgi:tRNA pseudouridine38-40 synthase